MAEVLAWSLYIIGACAVTSQAVSRDHALKHDVIIGGMSLLWPVFAVLIVAARVAGKRNG